MLPHGAGVSTIAKAAVYGFLAFAGFEGAAALGEETSNPKREIPRAIKTAVVVVGAFYLLTAASQSLGYGANAVGAKAYARRAAVHRPRAGLHRRVVRRHPQLHGDRQPVRDLARRRQRRRPDPVRAGARRDRDPHRPGRPVQERGARGGAGRRDRDHRHQPDRRAAGRRVGRERHVLGARRSARC